MADGLPPDIEAKGDIEDEGAAVNGEKSHVDMTSPDKGGKKQSAGGGKSDADIQTPDTEDDKKQEEEAEPKKQEVPFELLDSMKDRLLRFELEVGSMNDIPTGRSLKDSFPEDAGVVFVDQVRYKFSKTYCVTSGHL